jgi:prolipoprotein diacylglyceryltransferase
LAAALGFGLFLALHKMSERNLGSGTLALCYLLGNGIGHFLLGFTRADEALSFGLLRATQIAELVEIVMACVMLLALRARDGTRVREEL